MFADTQPMSPAFPLQQPDAAPAPREPLPARPVETAPLLRPAVDLETRLILRDLGWRP